MKQGNAQLEFANPTHSVFCIQMNAEAGIGTKMTLKYNPLCANKNV